MRSVGALLASVLRYALHASQGAGCTGATGLSALSFVATTAAVCSAMFAAVVWLCGCAIRVYSVTVCYCMFAAVVRGVMCTRCGVSL